MAFIAAIANRATRFFALTGGGVGCYNKSIIKDEVYAAQIERAAANL
jgi:hypothetical protein